MALQPNIILAGQPVDVIGSMSRGNQLAAESNQLRDQNALRQVYQTQGQGLLRGDQGALNALAAIDPAQAMGLQNSFQETQTRIQVMNAEERRAAQEFAAKATAEQKAAATAEVQNRVKALIAAPSPEVFDRLAVENGKPEWVGMFAQRQSLAIPYMDDWKSIIQMTQGPEAPKPADDYQRYVQEETAAGRQPMSRIEFAQAIKGNAMTIETVNPDGSRTIVSQGGPATGAQGQTVGDVYKPGTTDQAISLIDQIANSPALERITGAWEGGGGNNIDDMSAARRSWYGSQGLDTIEKINQLQSQAWMAARAMLKGGGQITDYESKKAEAAVARLSRAKGTEEFRAALKDLRDAITEGEAKLRAAQGIEPPPQPDAAQPAPTENLSDDDLLRMYGG